MSSPSEMAARLRQAVQGCTCHTHGPVQAWDEIEQAGREGTVRLEDVARLATEACTHRIAELLERGVREEDPRIRKEELTRRFIEKLLG